MSTPCFCNRLLLLAAVVLAAAGCTASKDIRTAQKRLRSVQDFREVELQTVSKPLSEYRKAEEDEVLYHLEHGMLAHYREQWNQSSQHFQQAQRAIDLHYTKSINRNVQSMLVNDLQLAYHGEAYEDIYLNAVKSLNYFHQDDLEGAMVEARKVTHELEQLNDRYKGLAESLSRDTAQTAVKKVDKRLEHVELLEEDEEAPVDVKQNSAFGRFLTTVLYAKRGSHDDARIEHRKLQTALEDQGNTDFLTAMVHGWDSTAAGESSDPSTPPDPSTELAVRLASGASSRPSTLTIRVQGRSAYTIPADSFQQRENAYAARIEGLPASPGDSVSVQTGSTVRSEQWLEVWSDSLQYRAPLAGDGRPATFVLGEPKVQSPPQRPPVSSESHLADEGPDTTLAPVELSYAVTRASSAERRQRKLVRTVRRARYRDSGGWRVVEHREPVLSTSGGLDTRVDTMYLSASTLRLERYRQWTAGGHRLQVRREDEAIIEAPNAWHIIPAKVPVDRAPYGEGMGIEVALAKRSLAVGQVFSLPVYVSSRERVDSVEVQVLGTDSVSTPAGRYATYDVRLRPSVPHQGTGRLYLRRSPPHHVIQATLSMPVLASGERDTLRVRRTLTNIRTLEASESRPGLIAGRKSDAPPSDLPAVRVTPDTAPQPRSPSDPSSGTAESGPQLTRPRTYNTMLVSFSGQAPIKQERKFSFSFTIDEEEFQLDFAIPVLELQGTTVDRVRAITGGDTLQVPLLEDMEAVAETMFDEKKSIIYTRAVIRSFLKAAATKGAQKLAEEEGNAGMAWLAKEAGQLASQYVAQADTRAWQTMPGFAYATVTKLPPGTHEVTFEFLSSAGGILKRRTRQVEVRNAQDLALAESIYLE